jgi:hypothetical protein
MLLVLHPSSLPPRWWSDWLKLQCTKSGNLIRWISCFYSFFEWRRKNQRLKQWSYATKKSERVIRNLPILFLALKHNAISVCGRFGCCFWDAYKILPNLHRLSKLPLLQLFSLSISS